MFRFINRSFKTINAAHLKNKEFTFLDVRPPANYASGHIQNAINVHQFFTYLATSNHQDFVTFFKQVLEKKGVDNQKAIVVYQDKLNGLFGASCRAGYILELLGLKNEVYVLQDGFEGWKKNSGQVQTQTPATSKSTLKPQFNEKMWMTKDDVLGLLKNKTTLIDVRNNDQFYAQSSSPYGKDFAPRKGNIPNAKHMEWTTFMETNKGGQVVFKAPQVIQKMVKDTTGFTTDNQVVLYCFKGARASNSFYAMKKAGFKNVRMYFAGWNEWSRDEKCPIERTATK